MESFYFKISEKKNPINSHFEPWNNTIIGTFRQNKFHYPGKQIPWYTQVPHELDATEISPDTDFLPLKLSLFR